MTQVLLVDDYPASRRFLREVLDEIGHEFLEAQNGQEAVETFARRRPDWTIMDVEMPEMDGLVATRAICDLDPNARVIVISQYTDTAYEVAARDAGALAFLHKDHLLRLPEILTAPSQAG